LQNTPKIGAIKSSLAPDANCVTVNEDKNHMKLVINCSPMFDEDAASDDKSASV
jgi:hypothetical protein